MALSGPNAMLVSSEVRNSRLFLHSSPNISFSFHQSRRAFDPQLDPNDLDRFTFNIVPERDIVPMFDDKAQNYQSKC